MNMPTLLPSRNLNQLLIYPLTFFLSLVFAGCSTTGKTQNGSDLMSFAAAGDVNAQYELGRDYAESTFSNQPQAIYWLCQAATQGHVQAQMRLARIFENDAKIAVYADNRLSNRGSVRETKARRGL